MFDTEMIEDQEYSSEQGIDFQGFVSGLKRHKKWASIITVSVFIVGAVVTFSWPTAYESTATILLEEPEVPPGLVQTTVTVFAEVHADLAPDR